MTDAPVNPAAIARKVVGTHWPELRFSARPLTRSVALSWVDSDVAPLESDVLPVVNKTLEAIDFTWDSFSAFALVTPSFEHLTADLVSMWAEWRTQGGIDQATLSYCFNTWLKPARTDTFKPIDATTRAYCHALWSHAGVTVEQYERDHLAGRGNPSLALVGSLETVGEAYAHAIGYPL